MVKNLPLKIKKLRSYYGSKKPSPTRIKEKMPSLMFNKSHYEFDPTFVKKMKHEIRKISVDDVANKKLGYRSYS